MDNLFEQQEYTLSNEVQQKFLESIENFVKISLPKLMEIVKVHCEQSFKEYETNYIKC
jgi:hypothetical protein